MPTFSLSSKARQLRRINLKTNPTSGVSRRHFVTSRVSDKTIVIPGHGPIDNKSQLTEFRDMLVAIHEKVAALKKQGKSRDEVVATKPTADYDAKWGGFVINGDFFTKLVYAGV
jgi:hypothetical protein